MKALVVVLIALDVLGALGSFYQVDKPRKPITFLTATIAAGITILNIWVLWRAYL